MAQQIINIGGSAEDHTGDGIRVGGDKINDNFTELYAHVAAKAFVGTPGTNIPTSANPVGDYTTKLEFQSRVWDVDNSIIDLANHRFNIISGYSWCRISYNLAWDLHATGWRGCRVKNATGSNYGNVRMPSVGSGATTNNNFISPWIKIDPTNPSAPDTINVGNYFEFWPAQTSGVDLICGADLPSWVQIEFKL